MKSILGIALALWLLAAPAGAQTRLYLGEYAFNDPKLKTMLLDGSGLTELTAPPASDWLLVGLDYDPGASHLYWMHGSTPGLIRRADADGGNPQLLVSGLKIPRGVALDLVNGWMYWSEAPPSGNASGLIRRARLDGSGLETIYALTPYDPVTSYVGKPVVDPVNGHVYFCAANEIRRVNLDGSGPVQTVVRGVTTVTAIDLDLANGRIYFLDANTNSDYLGCASPDDTGFTVLLDNSPGAFGTSGLFDLELDLNGGRAYFTDELAETIRSCRLDGSDATVIYTGPGTHYPTGLTLDADPMQPMQDCNDNGVADRIDVESGTSEDCNGNGIPDECETDPCAVVDWSLDNGSDPDAAGRSLSGNPTTGYEVFQPFTFLTIPEVPGVTYVRIGLDGWTVNHHPAGFRATIFPDDGSGQYPDESEPLATADFQFRFSPNTTVWVYRDLHVFLAPGRYYVRLSALDPQYEASVNIGTSGEPSFSRRLSNGQFYHSSHSIAMRLEAGDATSVGPHDAAPGLRLFAPWPNPAAGTVAVSWSLARPGHARISVIDPSGRVVLRILDRWCDAGSGSMRWDGRGTDGRRLPSGVYLVRLESAGKTATSRMVLMR